MSNLNKDYFYDEEKAIKFLESVIWKDGVVCPHCSVIDRAPLLRGKSTRIGLRKCLECRKQFTVRINTIFESSHIPIYKWLQASYLMASSKKGISAHQLHRTLQITYKSAWFMAHRIREAMKTNDNDMIGGMGQIVEVDETYVGGHTKDGHGGIGKMVALGMLERKGKILTQPIAKRRWDNIILLINKSVKKGSIINSDGAPVYFSLPIYGYELEQVNHHKKEFVRDNNHINTIESYFSLFKRGMTGIYQHCSPHHLKRYLYEFDFRYNYKDISDMERFYRLLMGICGKRLTYKEK